LDYREIKVKRGYLERWETKERRVLVEIKVIREIRERLDR
jgi:hypothetical protein